MNALYKTIGVSKQAVYQYAKRQHIFDAKATQLVAEAEKLREEHPGCGVEKMYHTLKPDFIGRDRFIEMMMALGFRIKRKKNYRRTTIASKIYYPNLIKGMEVVGPCQVWQSDITYIPVKDKHYYAVFIIDVYTKKIVGYQVSDHMRATANVKAMEMALRSHPPPRIHHSDRGSQYIYKKYIEILKQHKCNISMSLTAQDNAYAERINRTIKEEYLDYWRPSSFIELKRYVNKAVKSYNHKRPHNGINKISPDIFEKQWYQIEEHLKPKITIFNNEIYN
jgi:transposase InsO family protein